LQEHGQREHRAHGDASHQRADADDHPAIGSCHARFRTRSISPDLLPSRIAASRS
jgi:hypothetical protein